MAAEEAKKPVVTDEEREAEVKALLEKARLKGIENQKRMADETAEKARIRAERLEEIKEKVKAKNEGPKGEGEDKGKDGDGNGEDDSPPAPPPANPKGGGGGDTPPEPPLALA